MNTNGNLLQVYIEILEDINQNYTNDKRFYRLYRTIDVFKHYIIHTKEFRTKHKGILLDILHEYYCYAMNNRL